MLELSLHVLDLLQNSIEAGARQIQLSIEEDLEKDRLTITAKDDGKGMSHEMTLKVLDPFVTTRNTRHVGLGLPLLAAAARQCEGGLWITSEPGKGTTVVATFRRSHWDRAPLGNMPATLLMVLLSGTPVDVLFTHVVGEREFQFDTAAVRHELGELPLAHPKVREWLMAALNEGEASLQQTNLNS